MVEVCLLGCGGVMPLPERWLSSLLIRCGGKLLLFDCGEGTQIPFRLAGMGLAALDAVCLTHYHADHALGLPGLLLTVSNSGRTEPVTIYGPPGLRQTVGGLMTVAPELRFELRLEELPCDRPAAVELPGPGGMRVESMPADHSIPCFAYRFTLARAAKFDPARAAALRLPVNEWKRLQRGETVRCGDRAVSPADVLGAPRRGISVGYCTDTRPVAAFTDFFRGVDLLVCEGLYGADDRKAAAADKHHMVFSQAARLALDAQARALWLTHFSPALRDPESEACAAREIFPAAAVGRNLMRIDLRYDD